MKSGILTALLAFALSTTAVVAQEQAANTSDSDMIVGGWPAKDNEWPWQVRLYSEPGDIWGFCGGSLIDSQWVLTAAHCVPGVSRAVVGYGSVNRDGQKRVETAGIFSHPQYDPNTSANDIALIKLASPVKFGKGTARVALANNERYKVSLGETAYVTGWGALMDQEKLEKAYPDGNIPWNKIVPMRLMEVDVQVQDIEECRVNYGSGAVVIPKGHLCAGYAPGGKDSCQGDSGGPLVVQDPTSRTGWTQLGVVSFGVGCARPQLYGVYTRVDYFRKWIKDTIAAN
jgi:secreted trypsin-like serine protease